MSSSQVFYGLTAVIVLVCKLAEAQGECDGVVGFELVTGYVFSAPSDMLDSQPGTLMLTECIEMCRNNETCMSANYETGLCVLFSSSAQQYPGSLTTSQFPVFTLYVQKLCLKDVPKCGRAWDFERVSGYGLTGFARKSETLDSKENCMEMCAKETTFKCRSANFNNVTKECSISDMDRHTATGTGAFREAEGTDYLENNCVDDPVKMCEFQRMDGRILKTVDSVFQNVDSAENCRQLCIEANYRCHSYDFGDTGENICRLSHHSMSTLTHIQEPYLEIPNSATYELSACYNVTIDCRASDMVVFIQTSKIFNGKIYAKGSPNSCVVDVTNSLEFELPMSYNDLDCNVKKEGAGGFTNEIVVQHHDRIVTSADLGLSVKCQYNLENRTVSNGVDINVTSDIASTFQEQSATVSSPNVIMRISDRKGGEVATAQVGDPLSLRFEVKERNTPYDIFIRDLVALDGSDNTEIILIDSDGCPTDSTIMGPVLPVPGVDKDLEAYFDAFKFPTSDIVSFRALVTPCIDKCPPTNCRVPDFVGQFRDTESYGRKKRHASGTDVQKRSTEVDDMMLVQSIHITDKFHFERPSRKYGPYSEAKEASRLEVDMQELSGMCINTIGLVVACSLFLLAQLVLIAAWSYIWQKKRKNKLNEILPEVTPESLSQLYKSGYTRRH